MGDGPRGDAKAQGSLEGPLQADAPDSPATQPGHPDQVERHRPDGVGMGVPEAHQRRSAVPHQIHPIAILSALLTYRAGKGARGTPHVDACTSGRGHPGPRLRQVVSRRRRRPTSVSTWASTCPGPWAVARSPASPDLRRGWPPGYGHGDKPGGTPTTTWRASQPGPARRPVRGPATGTPGPTQGWPHWTSPPRIASGT